MFTSSGGVKTKFLKAGELIELSEPDAQSTASNSTSPESSKETEDNVVKMKSKNSWVRLEEPRYVPESVDI